MANTDPRPYELVLFGATGITGQYCAEHVASHLPTDLRWAIAGRSAAKLQKVLDVIKALNPNRKQPATEICGLDDDDLSSLAPKTSLIVNCVGPYALYGEPVMRACTRSGTAYIDTTGEVPWVAKMIGKYGSEAQSNGSIIIPQCGFESSASDMLVLEAVRAARDSFGTGVKHVTGTVYKMQAQITGGTLASVFTAFDEFTIPELTKCQKPFALSPVPHAAPREAPKGILHRLTETSEHPILGPQAIYPLGPFNAAIVQRTWGLLDGGKRYGDQFTYAETMRVRNRLLALVLNIGMVWGSVLLAIPPVKWVLRRLVRQPGIGPDRDSDSKSLVDLRAIAEADDGSGRRVESTFKWKGSIYHLTGVLLMEAAISLLRDGESDAKKIGGGILTPATLGEKYADRLRGAGITLEAREV